MRVTETTVRPGGVPVQLYGEARERAGQPGIGGDAAFAGLYERQVALVYRYLYGQTGSRETAEDLTSLTFMRALAAFPRYRPDYPPHAWLLRIAHNVLIDHRRAATRTARLIARLAGLRAEPTWIRSNGEDLGNFLGMTAGLPKAQRDALALRFLADLDVKEVAAVLGRSRGATRMLLSRALETLRTRTVQEGKL